jgi:predicted ATPase
VSQLWRIQLFEGPQLLTAEGVALHRFRSQRVGALLAYLALHLDRPCPREELAEALWPEEDPLVTANRLRVTLASLRKQLEPPGVAFGSVLDVSHARRVRLRADAVWCDTRALEQALKAQDDAHAAALAVGTLLPDYYDSWVVAWRERLVAQTASLPQASSSASQPPLPKQPPAAEPMHHRVPRYLTRFFGRERELQEVREQLTQASLVSLIGPGGVGKSRLAVEAVAGQTRRAVFVGLADLSADKRLVETILEVLSPHQSASGEPFEQLVTRLGATPTLLILDNAETFVEPVAALVLRLLERVPSLQILVTSRQRLEIPGEVVLPVLPLEIPSVAARPERLTEFPAVALFVDRARGSLPDFVLAPRHTQALVEICQRLEGVPLALELAAARMTVQTPAQLAATLAQSLTMLKSRQRGLPERHRSLRAVAQGSIELLTPELCRFFAQLSVFRGGWSAQAAAAVTGRADAEALLEELVVRSLVTVWEDRPNGPLRYRFLELLRPFAQETLPSDERATLTQRHTDYFLTCAAHASGIQRASLEPLDGEGENLRTALEWASQSPSELFWLGLRGLLVHAQIRGLHRQVQDWIERVLDGSLEVPKTLTGYQMRNLAARILSELGHFEQSRRLMLQDRVDAQAAGFPVMAVYATNLLGYLAMESGEPVESLVLLRDALERALQLTDSGLQNECRFLVARALLVCAENSPSPSERLELLQEAERHLRSLLAGHGDSALFFLGLGASLLGQGRLEEASEALEKTRKLAQKLQESSTLLYCLAHESRLALLTSNPTRAALLQGAYESLREQMGYVAPTSPAASTREELQEHLGAEALHYWLLRGRQTALDELFAAEFPLNETANT